MTRRVPIKPKALEGGRGNMKKTLKCPYCKKRWGIEQKANYIGNGKYFCNKCNKFSGWDSEEAMNKSLSLPEREGGEK